MLERLQVLGVVLRTVELNSLRKFLLETLVHRLNASRRSSGACLSLLVSHGLLPTYIYSMLVSWQAASRSHVTRSSN